MAGKSKIFDPITSWYDRLNAIFSLGADRLWRKKCVQVFDGGEIFVDLASGTGKTTELLASEVKGSTLIAIDPSFQMVKYGLRRGRYRNVHVILAVGEEIPLKSSTVSGVTCTFGLRNFTNLKKALSEVHRILKPGGIFSAVEVTIPQKSLVRAFFLPYFTRIMPAVGNAVSGTRSYTYLKNSVMAFPSREDMIAILKETGFSKCHYMELTLGIASHYVAIK